MAKSGVVQVHLQARSASNQQDALWFILGKPTNSSIQVDIFIFIPSVLLKYFVNGICIVIPLFSYLVFCHENTDISSLLKSTDK